jgi:hypothetical protein
MNLRAVIFAGTGLFLSCSATAVWVGHDMADIRARELAKRAAACAAQGGTMTGTGTSQAQPSGAVDPNTGQPVTTTAPPPNSLSSKATTCSKPTTSTTGDASTVHDNGALDQAMPGQATDGSQVIDPQTGAPASSADYADQSVDSGDAPTDVPTGGGDPGVIAAGDGSADSYGDQPPASAGPSNSTAGF